jgi:glycine cleavage system H protein
MKSCTRVYHSMRLNYYTVLTKKFSKFFAKSHEWVSVDKGIATVGISDFAQSELGEIVHVELPKVGESMKSGDTLGAVESVKTASDIYSPVEGVLSEVNHELTKNPNLMNQQAETGGWYVKLKVHEAKVIGELSHLMNADQYHKYIKDSKH